MIAELADRLASGEFLVAAMVGAEAISTVRHLKAVGETRDWNETSERSIDDRGRGLKGLITRTNLTHGVTAAPVAYALLENARRARRGTTRKAYLEEMGQLFAPFTAVAAANPYSSAAVAPSTSVQLSTPGERNRPIADPYLLKLVSRDQVNQAAAVLLMTVDRARTLGISEDRWIFIHGCALADEREILCRPDLGASVAASATLHSALGQAGRVVEEISWFDFYSCFPIAVFAAIDGLGLSPDDLRGLTVTGGLPYFGGPGNNYSMHAFATMTERLRDKRDAFGLIGVNGGFISKYGAAVLSAKPAPWRGCEHAQSQRLVDAQPMPAVDKTPHGKGRILTYTVTYQKGEPDRAIIVGELENGARFLANDLDAETRDAMLEADPVGSEIWVRWTPLGNRFAFDAERLEQAFAPGAPSFREAYEFVAIERRGRVLEVTIDRPDVRNCLSPEANDELAEIFDAFEADGDLWVAIITGAGDQAFCAGADLKRQASGKPSWIPESGFAGLTSRAARTKPVIAAVNGIAFGGGFEIALACDLIVADPSARFALSEVKVGMVAAAGGIARLPREVPRKLAVELLLTGRTMTAKDAARRGLVNRISAPGVVLEEARRLAEEIVAASPTSVRLTLRMLAEADRYADAGEAARASQFSSAVDDLVVSDDFAEGIYAFAQKRVPQWRNR
jgi:acetyl-CoA C-acetyltransferase